MEPDTTNQQEKAVKKEKLVVPTKPTLNLCMKEKAMISPALFVPILIVILALAIVIGYFGVYKPYQSVKDRQAELDAAKSKLQQTYDGIEAYDDKYKDENGNGGIVKEYNRYNYEGYDDTIADRLDVLAILETHIFPVAHVNSVSIADKTMSLTISGIGSAELSDLIVELSQDELVATVKAYRGSDMDDETDIYSSTVNMTITLNNAAQGGN